MFTNLALFNVFFKVTAGSYIGHDGVFKTTNFCFVGVAAIVKNNIIAPLFNQLVDLGRLEVFAAVNDTFFGYFNFVRSVKRNNLGFHFYF